MRSLFTLLALAGTISLAAPSLADDSTLTPEELAAKFLAQKATRGLVIVPSTDQAVEPAEGAAVLPEGVDYAAVAPENQVNFEINFAFDSAALEASEVAKLDNLCQMMQTADLGSFKIIGHTDASGTDSYNQNLSLLRAEEVKRHLVEGCGVPADKLVAEGVGEAFPLNAGDPKADVNRRVEFQLGS